MFSRGRGRRSVSRWPDAGNRDTAFNGSLQSNAFFGKALLDESTLNLCEVSFQQAAIPTNIALVDTQRSELLVRAWRSRRRLIDPIQPAPFDGVDGVLWKIDLVHRELLTLPKLDRLSATALGCRPVDGADPLRRDQRELSISHRL